MAWTRDHYPDEMNHFNPAFREKAIEFTNALLDQGVEQGKAIEIGIEQARHWAENRGIETGSVEHDEKFPLRSMGNKRFTEGNPPRTER